MRRPTSANRHARFSHAPRAVAVRSSIVELDARVRDMTTSIGATRRDVDALGATLDTLTALLGTLSSSTPSKKAYLLDCNSFASFAATFKSTATSDVALLGASVGALRTHVTDELARLTHTLSVVDLSVAGAADACVSSCVEPVSVVFRLV